MGLWFVFGLVCLGVIFGLVLVWFLVWSWSGLVWFGLVWFGLIFGSARFGVCLVLCGLVCVFVVSGAAAPFVS